jgi:hypothetical protein
MKFLLRCLLITYLTFYQQAAHSQLQLYYRDQHPKTDTSALRIMFIGAKKLEKEITVKGQKIGRLDVMETDSGIIALARGRLDVFRWEGQRWENLYKGIFFGHNSYSKNFTCNNEIYSFGGYGFWTAHGKLLKFDFVKGDWDLVSCSKDLYFSLAYQIPEGLRLFGNHNFILDIQRNKLVPYQPEFNAEKYIMMANLRDIEFENYAYFAYTIPVVVIDKRTHQAYQSELKPITYNFSNPMREGIFHIYGDSLFSYFSDFRPDRVVDLKQEVASHFKLQQASFNTRFKQFDVVMIASGVVLMIILLIYYARNQHGQRNEDYSNIIAQLTSGRDKIINMPDLDRILQIDNIENQDTLKFRRHQKIQDLNRFYLSVKNKELIVRVKDAEDKRRFMYVINK